MISLGMTQNVEYMFVLGICCRIVIAEELYKEVN